MRFSIFFSTLFLLFPLFSCSKYPDIDEQTDAQDIVLTEYDRTTNFSSYNTFTLPDTIFVIKDTAGKDEPIVRPVDQSTEDLINERIRANMESRGFVYSDVDPDFSFQANIAIVRNVNIYQNIGWYPWWGPYPGYPSYGYPFYYYSVEAYDTGTITIFLEDLVNDPIDESDSIAVPWRAMIQGVVDGNLAYDQNRLQVNIDQSFTQSPYLSK